MKYCDELEIIEKDEKKLDQINSLRAKIQQGDIFSQLQEYGKKRSLEQRVQRIFGKDMDTNAAKARANIMTSFFNKADLLRDHGHGTNEKKKDNIFGLFKKKPNEATSKVAPETNKEL